MKNFFWGRKVMCQQLPLLHFFSVPKTDQISDTEYRRPHIITIQENNCQKIKKPVWHHNSQLINRHVGFPGISGLWSSLSLIVIQSKGAFPHSAQPLSGSCGSKARAKSYQNTSTKPGRTQNNMKTHSVRCFVYWTFFDNCTQQYSVLNTRLRRLGRYMFLDLSSPSVQVRNLRAKYFISTSS